MIESAPIQQTPDQSKVVLGHGYWMGERRIREGVLATVLGLMSHMTTRAEAVILHELAEEARKKGQEEPAAVSSLGQLRGPDKPSEGDLMLNGLVNYGVPVENIIRESNTYSTWGEVKAAAQVAREKGKSIVDIAFSEHLKSIKILFSRLGKVPGVEYGSTESILKEKDVHRFSRDYVRRITNEDGTISEETVHIDHKHNHTARLVERWEKSIHAKIYKWTYEFPKRWALKLHLANPDKLEERNRMTRQDKDPGKEWIFPFDRYFLNGQRPDAFFVPPLLKAYQKLQEIRGKSTPEPQKARPKTAGQTIEVFPAGPVKRTN